MTVKRTIGGKEIEIQLTDEELSEIYYAQREKHFREWVMFLLSEYISDVDKISDEQFDEIYNVYMETMEGGNELGDLEHQAFEDTLAIFPELDALLK